MHPRTPRRQDTLDLVEQREHDQHQHEQGQAQQQRQQHQGHHYAPSDEEHSILEDDSEDERYAEEDEEDDGSSSLSIPNESIDFDLVYSLHTFVATVEGQANVVKGDSLFLMDDSNSYWWLVRVLKTQEVGYIPAENIETPFERLARLNKHRNVDLAAATQTERNDDIQATRERVRNAMARTASPSHQLNNRKCVIFTGSSVFHYPAAIWGDQPEGETDDDDFDAYEAEEGEDMDQDWDGMEPDDGMSWDEEAAEEEQNRRMAEAEEEEDVTQPSQAQQQGKKQVGFGNTPIALRPGAGPAPSETQDQMTPAAQQAQLGLGAAPPVRLQTSRERLTQQQQDPQQAMSQSSSGRSLIDPAEATGTRQLSVTPTVARGTDTAGDPSLGRRSASPSSVNQTRERSSSLHRTVSGDSGTSMGSEAAKRSRDVDAGNDSDGSESTARKKGRKPSDSGSSLSLKLRKSGRSTPPEGGDESGGEGPKEKKKKGGMFGGLFSSKKKDKKEKDSKKNGAISPGSTNDNDSLRASEDSSASPSMSSSPADGSQPNAASRRQDSRLSQSSPSSQVVKMQKKDQAEMAQYQQYLSRSPSSPPDASLAYGTWSAASQGHNITDGPSPRNLAPGRPGGRPGSLIFMGNASDAAIVPELSVMRVFAGERLQSEATFKTVLLNSSTTAADLMKQAMQRFRLPHGEDERDYYLTVKQFEGDEAVLKDDERPLGVFEELVETAMSIPTVKRSSISSISSNLSMQPAITKLGMNDFTDDSAVKFYLNRRLDAEGLYNMGAGDVSGLSSRSTEGSLQDKTDDRALSASATDHVANAMGKLTNPSAGRPQLSLNVGSIVAADRFSSPTSRFSIQVAIFPEDLPDGIVFDPHTEAIVPKYSLQNRSQQSTTASPGISQTQRKKVFVFPKNTTVAEVVEQSLDMFGIQEGMVDGGDEVEDKVLKKRSASRVRYGLAVQIPGDAGERELAPSSKVLDAFQRPPVFKQNNNRSSDLRRRSMDSSQMLGSMDDVQPGDPVFILRRAATYRNSNSARRRLSAPLDDLALHQQHLQRDHQGQSQHRVRESVNSLGSEHTIQSEYTSATDSPRSPKVPQAVSQMRAGVHPDILAARNATSKVTSRVFSAHSNSDHGVDLLLPDRGTLRSMRAGGNDRMRYSFIEPDGETYDISDIIEEELWDVGGATRNDRSSLDEDDETFAEHSPERGSQPSHARTQSGGRGDLLEDVLVKPKEVVVQRIDQVLAKIKGEKAAANMAASDDRRRSPGEDGRSDGRSPTPVAGNRTQQTGSRSNTPVSYSRGPTPDANGYAPSRATGQQQELRQGHSQQTSSVSTVSDYHHTDVSTPGMKSTTTMARTTPSSTPRPPVILKDDFGMSKMMAVIEAGAILKRPPPPPPMDEVDQMLFGSNISISDLHPEAQEIFSPVFDQLEDLNQAPPKYFPSVRDEAACTSLKY
ncbi:hypothetical protein FRB97_008453 [Tulasnella sp. 331]|nr:hypothetical protein FRB97_008453 [Tulasnella sp. 331]